MGHPLYHVDAFTARPFAGNPAAVCLLERPAEGVWMQQVAAELNLSETAFLHPEVSAWRLRWFTPKVEVALCGHATLASAHILWETGRLPGDAVARFQTLSGPLAARRRGDWIELDFPAKRVMATPAPAGLLDALGCPAVFVGRNDFDYFVEVDSESGLRGLKPDFAKLAQIPVRGVIVTCRSESPEFDFISRFFAPAVGVNEDPVTGSAHCGLGPYWQERLKRDGFTASQASARGGVIRVRVMGDRVQLGGQAVTVARGELA
jgi:predicted PhzF superfamily epimerase YddE/YHI9